MFRRSGILNLGISVGHGKVAFVSEIPGEPERASDMRTILIVEDELLVRLALSDDLRDAGFLVIEAYNADEAVLILQSSLQLDVLITDIRMPGSMDGAALASYVRASWPQLKIVFISGNLADLPVGTPADALIEKPYVQAAVIERIQQLLSGSQQWEAT